MENIKKYKFSLFLLVVSIVLSIFYFSLPSKETVKELELKNIKQEKRIVEINTYFIENNNLKPFLFKINEDSYTNLLISTVEEIILRSNLSDIHLISTYFSDDTVFFKFNTKNIPPLLKEAISKTSLNLTGIQNIKFI